MHRSKYIDAILGTLLTTVLAGGLVLATSGPAQATAADPFRVVDPQNWENPDHMTWSDYVAPPGTTWNDPARRGSVRDFDIALVTLDYPDQPFVVTQQPGSTIFGNPQPAVSGLDRADVPAYYRDLLNTPNELNGGHTLHEYWMGDSGGRFGVDLTAYGAYQMPNPSYEYGISNDMNPGMCPAGSTCNRNLRTDALAAWRADVGADVAGSYELVFILSAGQDESSTWQEFGEMRFATKEDVTDVFGPPVEPQPNYAKTRYVDWTSWASAATIWPNAGGGSSTQAESSGMGVYAHELSHLLSIGDNYNNPYGVPLRRAYTGPWSMMSRGSFNGPGGPHTRWQIPAVRGGSMGSLHTLRDKAKIGLVDERNVLRLSREALADSGLVVADVTARAVDPGENGLMGLNIAMDADREPACQVETDVLCDGGGYDNYTIEVVDRVGADSFTPDAGVLISKTKDQDRQPFQWVVDANPQDIAMTDFTRPGGGTAMITMGDYRQLSDALLHAGTRSGSEYEYVDEANRLHFYVLNLRRDGGELSYTVAVRSLDGAGASKHGVRLGAGTVTTATRPTRGGVTCSFPLTNTGGYVAGGGHPEDASAYLTSDVYRLSATVTGRGWRAVTPNALATAKFGATTTVAVAVGADAGAAPAGVVSLTATSESDPAKTVTRRCVVVKA
ncbi:M6 family metalloprotease domain-containing protein [Winogradskya consettensis]|uniref:Peptidase M6 n=1 Tax=Winogradskya consettensis TaxID=113560 RepID=A0A919VNH6_9ACTN|nr:M6 family metalloprotease domain-containing protein [Actinoplanes consettensis]GIM69925.1 peptidase M6 [Actinoplanes consettensis]